MKIRFPPVIKNTKIRLANMVFRSRIRSFDFTIVSSNCWGGSIYQELGIQYNTPFVGLFLFAPCYIKLLGNLDVFLQGDFTFVKKSKYSIANEFRRSNNRYYPLGVLNGDIEVHFLHYENEEEAVNKWSYRRDRMNKDRLFIGFSDRNLCEEKHLRQFDSLNFTHKVAFTAKPHPDLKSLVWISEYANRSCVENLHMERYAYRRHFDVADWLNGGTGEVTSSFYKFTNRLLEVPIKRVGLEI